MKKLFLSAIVCTMSLLIVSCTSETDVITGDTANHSGFKNKSLSTSDLDRAKQLYIDMVASQEYTDYKNAARQFRTKLDVHYVSFSNKKDWMDWIAINISSTNYNTVYDFEKEYDGVMSKFMNMVDANTYLFTLIKDSDQDDIYQIIGPEHGEPIQYPPTSTSCEDACYDACDAALDFRSQTLYDMTLALAGMADDYPYYEAFGNMMEAYEDSWNCIVDELNLCIGNC